MPRPYESFKDFIESTGNSELLDLYSDFLKTGNDELMMKKLKGDTWQERAKERERLSKKED